MPNILADSSLMTTEQWEMARQHGPNGDIPFTIGGSDVATLFGVNPFNDILSLWMEKKGRKVRPPMNQDILDVGHWLEPVVRQVFKRRTGYTVLEDNNFYQHSKYPFMLANIDGKYINKDGDLGILECKTTTFRTAFDHWGNGRIPANYELQLRFYMSVLDIDEGSFAAWWGNDIYQDFAFPMIKRDPDIEEEIIERCCWFIESLETNTPPTLTTENCQFPKLGLASLATAYPVDPTLGVKVLGDSIVPVVQKYLDADAQIKSFTKMKEEAQMQLAQELKDAEHGMTIFGDDKYIVDYSTTLTSRLDTKAVKEQYPEIYDELTKTTSSRKMSVKIRKAK